MDNRSLILENALSLFSRHGYDAVGVQEISDSSGVSKPTLYHYFGSKQGLLSSIFELKLEPVLLGIESDCVYDHDLGMNLLRSCLSIFALAQREPALLRLVLGSSFCAPESELSSVASPWNARLSWIFERLFKNAESDHGNMRGRSSLHAASFLGTVFIYASLSLTGKIKTNEDLARLLVKTFMHGIFS